MGAQVLHSDPLQEEGFASLLANLTAPQPSQAPRWEDELEDDVATLSYEQALKANARYRPQVDMPMPPASETPTGAAQREVEMSAAHFPSQLPRPELKVASITIRMSHAESEQLRQRAATAGLTVSAYLRSCTLEAEHLREMVKQTMAELKTATEKQKQIQMKAPRGRWLRRLFPFPPAA